MVFDIENGSVYTALHSNQVELVHGIIPLIKTAKKLGYKIIVISNQPNIGLKRISQENFEKVHQKMEQVLKKNGVSFDAYYYCFHHPFAKIKSFRKKCDCRKPKPGLFYKAAKEHSIDLTKSWMIGDGVADIIAGYSAGVKTILLANIAESEYLRILSAQLKNIQPTHVVKNLTQAANFI